MYQFPHLALPVQDDANCWWFFPVSTVVTAVPPAEQLVLGLVLVFYITRKTIHNYFHKNLEVFTVEVALLP
jgi:hypothetical protein